jgi:hypothetical protein
MASSRTWSHRASSALGSGTKVERERKGIVLCKQLRQNYPHRELRGEALAGEPSRLAAYMLKSLRSA